MAAAFKWLYKVQQYLYWKFDFHSHHQALASLETPVQMVCLYNTSNCSFSVLFCPLFSLEAAVSVFASTLNDSKNSPTSIKIWHFITKWLFGFHSCVIFNTFRFQSTHFMVTKTIKLAGNFKLPARKLFTSKIIYVQVEIIVISIRGASISLQFYLSL